jgi:hypothetical protein
VWRGARAPEPEILAHHLTQAGLIEAASEWWGKAAQQSLERSALVEAIALFTRALDQIAILPTTPALRREQIKLQVALITPLMHVKGQAAPESKAAAERARLIEQAEVLGEPPEDPLLLFSALYGVWVATFQASNGDVVREFAAKFLALAEKQGGTVPLRQVTSGPLRLRPDRYHPQPHSRSGLFYVRRAAPAAPRRGAADSDLARRVTSPSANNAEAPSRS